MATITQHSCFLPPLCWSVDVPPPPPPPLLQPHGRFNAQQIQTRAHGDGAGFAQQNASVFHRTAQHPAVSGKRGDGAGQLVQVGTHCSHGVRGRENISNQSICNLKWDKSIGQTRETRETKRKRQGRTMVGHQGLAKQFQDVGQFAQLQHQGLFRGFVARHQQSGVAPQNGPRVFAALWGGERETHFDESIGH